MADCPFRLCTANVIFVVEQLRPDDDELTTTRVPMHVIQGVSLFITCPASLLGMPMTQQTLDALDEQASTIERMLADQGSPPPPAHPTNPKPRSAEPSEWFRNSDGNPNGPYPPVGPLARPKLGFITPTGGNANVASVAEINAAIDRATVLMAEAKESIIIGGSKLGEALQIINFVRETSVDTIGAPQVTEAIDLTDRSGLLVDKAIEIAVSYKGRS